MSLWNFKSSWGIACVGVKDKTIHSNGLFWVEFKVPSLVL